MIQPRHSQAILDQLSGLHLVEGEELVRHIDPICEIFKSPYPFQEFHLGKKNHLEKFVFVGFVVQKTPQKLDMRSAQFLTLIDDQDNGSSLFHSHPEQILLNLLSIVERTSSRWIDSEQRDQIAEELKIRAEPRIQKIVKPTDLPILPSAGLSQEGRAVVQKRNAAIAKYTKAVSGAQFSILEMERYTALVKGWWDEDAVTGVNTVRDEILAQREALRRGTGPEVDAILERRHREVVQQQLRREAEAPPPPTIRGE